jgi:GtrA-like protein
LPAALTLDTWPCQRGCVAVDSQSAPVGRGERFHLSCERMVGRLPFGLSRVVAPTFLGFAVINGFTFGVDLLLLTGLHRLLRAPLPIAVTAAYVCAFALSYFLNRTLNSSRRHRWGRSSRCTSWSWL